MHSGLGFTQPVLGQPIHNHLFQRLDVATSLEAHIFVTKTPWWGSIEVLMWCRICLQLHDGCKICSKLQRPQLGLFAWKWWQQLLTKPVRLFMLFLPRDKIFKFSARTRKLFDHSDKICFAKVRRKPFTSMDLDFHKKSSTCFLGITDLLNPFKFPIFSMQFVDSESFLQTERQSEKWWKLVGG